MIILNENGAVLIIALLILSLLTIMGIAATTTSTIENQIVLNERKRKENLYAVEASVLEAAQRLENSSDINLILTPGTNFNVNNSLTWFANSLPSSNINILTRKETSTLRYRIEKKGIANGETLTMGGKKELRVYNFTIYGLYKGEKNNGQAAVEIGYKKRFYNNNAEIHQSIYSASSWTEGMVIPHVSSVTDSVVDTTKITKDKVVKWQYPPEGVVDLDMGYSFTQAAIVNANISGGANKQVVIFGNGYPNASGDAVLYILDAVTGLLIKKINTGNNTNNGLSTPAIIDVNDDGKVDYVYAGDLKGNMWKFDLTSPLSSELSFESSGELPSGDMANDWDIAFYDGTDAKPLFQATDQPITSKPDIMKHCSKHGYIVLFGTGAPPDENSINDKNIQTIYGIWDYGDDKDNGEYLGTIIDRATGQLSEKNNLTVPNTKNLYLLKQEQVRTINFGENKAGIITSKKVVWQVVDDPDNSKKNKYQPDIGSCCMADNKSECCNDVKLLCLDEKPELPCSDLYPSNNDCCTLNPDLECCKVIAGWYFDLPIAGERVIKDPIIRDGRAIVVSFIPDSVEGTSSDFDKGKSFLNEMDACTGAAIDVFDVNQDGVINEADLISADLDGDGNNDINENGDIIKYPVSRVEFEGLLDSPVIRLTDKNREVKEMKSSSGKTETILEKQEKKGLYYWQIINN